MIQVVEMDELLSSRYFSVRVDPVRRVVVLRRLPDPFTVLQQLESCFTAVHVALGSIDRGTHALLIDSRDGPARNDPEFEKAFEPHRKRCIAGFARAAVLVRTASGRLQARRLGRSGGFDLNVFEDEEAALKYLTGDGTKP
jgi:hypothetical protein